MRRSSYWLSLPLALGMLLSACSTVTKVGPPVQPALAPPVVADDLRVMTFNLRYPAQGDGLDQWQQRRQCVADVLGAQAADVIGLQEAFKSQLDDLRTTRPEFTVIGRSRYGNEDNEYTAIAYRSSRLQQLDSGDFWLSDTPEVAGSISWGNALPRMVTWARFRDRGSGREFLAANTHYPWRGQDADARLRATTLLVERIDSLANGLPVVLLGDFNTTPDTPPHGVLSDAGLQDAWLQAADRSGPEGTWHAFKGVPRTRIDWVFSRGFEALQATTQDAACPSGRFPSDHFPVLAVLRWLPLEAR